MSFGNKALKNKIGCIWQCGIYTKSKFDAFGNMANTKSKWDAFGNMAITHPLPST